jgi:uracil permease
LIIAAISLATTILVSLLGKGMFRLIPILCGIIVGYAISLPLGLVDFSPVGKASWLALPNFVFPEWNFQAILFILPVAIAPAIEHFGDILAIGSITKQNYLESPGVHRTLFGDGLATSMAAFLGGPPNTTYSEVTGAVGLLKVYNPGIMTWAAIFAVLLSFVGKIGALLQTIPVPVMGGIMILLFGAIMVVGVNTMIRAELNLMHPRNMAIAAVIVVCGIGGMSFEAGILGVLLNLILPQGNHIE